MSETLKLILQYVTIFLGSTVGTAIIGGLIKGAIEKRISKKNIKETVKAQMELTGDAIVDKIKTTTFKQSIQPIVNSELEKVNEKADAHLRKVVDKVLEKDEKIINILERFIAYFDYSIGVPEKVKEEAKEAIAQAKADKKPVENAEVEFEVLEKEPEVVEVVENKPKINPMR